MTDFIDAQGFRANVGIVLIRDGGEVFLGSRSDGRGWQFPQGGVRRNESPEEALFRELHEEVGLGPDDVEVMAGTRQWLRYRLPRQFVRRRSRPLCIGQKQRWFLLRMVGGEDRLRFDVTPKPEFDAWRWVDYWSPVREVIYFKRLVYARALGELARHRVSGRCRRRTPSGGRTTCCGGRRRATADAPRVARAARRAGCPKGPPSSGGRRGRRRRRPAGSRVAARAGPGSLALLVVAAGAFWLGHGQGQRAAGYDAAAGARERRALESEVARLESRNATLNAKVAELEMARRLDREAYGQVERTLGDLQSRLARQSDDLAFYRSIVSPADGVQGLRIQRFAVRPGTQPREFVIEVTLIQAMRQDSTVSGLAQVVDPGHGRRARRPVTPLGQLLGRPHASCRSRSAISRPSSGR